VPTVFLLVNKTWNNLALSLPRLWNSFELILKDGNDSATADRLVSIVALWLKRSGEVPLSVKLHYIAPILTQRGVFNECAPALLKLLLGHSHRLEAIQLQVPAAALDPFVNYQLPRLQKLILDVQDAPPAFSLMSLGVDWTNLRELNVFLELGSLLTLDELWHIFSLATNLATCTINAQCVFHRQVTAKALVMPISHLELTLQGESSFPAASLTRFLASLDLPLLSELRIRWFVRETALWSDSSSGAFGEFLEQHQYSLERLHLAYLPISEEQLICMLFSVPYLAELVLQHSISESEPDVVTPRFFQASQKLQSLKSLHLGTSGLSWTPDGLFALYDRLRQGFKFGGVISEKAYDGLREIFEEWTKQGFAVDMRYLTIR